jgi:AcrR family transcriptional regulator
MAAPRGASEKTKADILAAARLLFAEQGFISVSIRDIAKAAGVTHGLVHYYFDTRQRLVSEVVRAEVAASVEVLLANPVYGSPNPGAVMRQVIRYFLTEKRTTLVLIARAELAGLEPEEMREPGAPGALGMIAAYLADLQKEAPAGHARLDPALVAAYIGAATFAFSILQRWLLTGVGLDPAEYESRLEGLVDISMALVGAAAGRPAGTA